MKYYVIINDKRYEVEVEKGEAAIVGTTEIAMTSSEKHSPVTVQTASDLKAPEPAIQSAEAKNENAAGEAVKAPMAGGITDVKVSIGSAVKTGDTLLLLEAMKMENEIVAHKDGIIAEILVSKGSFVSTDDVLVVIN